MAPQATGRFKDKDITSPLIKSSLKCDKGTLSLSSRGSLLISSMGELLCYREGQKVKNEQPLL